jgi:hypothetical protein
LTADNLSEQLQILKSLQGKKLTKRKLKRLDFGGCPVFGHICPGGVGQAQYCRSIEAAEDEADNLDFTREEAASRHPLDYLLSQISASGDS